MLPHKSISIKFSSIGNESTQSTTAGLVSFANLEPHNLEEPLSSCKERYELNDF